MSSLPSNEYNYLQTLYNSTGGPYWTNNRNWDFRDPALYNPCLQSWYGINVTYPNSSSLCNVLDLGLGWNNLTNLVPSPVSNFQYMEKFHLDNNWLQGPLPIFRNNSKLININMKRNNLHGTISNEMFDTEAYTVVYAIRLSNNFLNGSVPTNFFNFTNIRKLDLGFNDLTGTIPELISNWKDMTGLGLSSNYFHGSLPIGMRSMTNIVSLGIYNNSFTGEILPFLEFWPGLSKFIASGNLFTGTIPPTLFNLTGLLTFGIEDNSLTGTVPVYSETSTPFPGLSYLGLAGNDLHGAFPEWVCLNEQIMNVDLSRNSFTGTLPACIGGLNSLKIFQVDDNQFSGTLSHILTEENFFPSLQFLSLGYNRFHGSFPERVLSYQKLKSFSAEENCFHGTLSESLCNNISQALTSLNLAGLGASQNCQVKNDLFPSYFIDRIDGSVPSCIWSLPHLSELYLGGNSFTGSIPSNLQVSADLTVLRASHNYLTGSIPVSIQSHSSMVVLDLSYNKLKGSIQYMDSLNDQTPGFSLNLTQNRLSGRVPPVFRNAPNVEILFGNVFSCTKSLPLNDPYFGNYFCGGNQWNFSMGVFLLSLLMLFCCFLGFGCYMRKKHPAFLVFLIPVTLGKTDGEESASSRRGNLLVKLQEILSADVIDFPLNFPTLTKEQYQNVSNFLLTLGKIIQLSLFIGGLVLIILLPIYAGLNSVTTFSKYQNQYSWIITSSYMTGLTPSVLLVVLWLGVFLFVVVFIKWVHPFNQPQETILTYLKDMRFWRLCRSANEETKAILEESHPSFRSSTNYDSNFSFSRSRISRLDKLSVFGSPKDQSEDIPQKQVLFFYALVFGVFSFNFTVAFVVNYYYLAQQAGTEENDAVKFLLQLAMATFKLVWNLFVIPQMVSGVKHFYFVSTGQIIRLYVIFLVMNTIIAPCLAAVVTDESCFKGVFIQPDSVSLASSNLYCLTDKICTYSDSTAIILPFMYYSTCGSKILTTYIPIFMYTYSILPVVNIFYHLLVVKIPLSYIPNIFYILIQGICRPQDFSKGIFTKLFRGKDVIASLVLHLTVLITFGISSPILALVIVITIAVDCLLKVYLILRFLKFEDPSEQQAALSQITAEEGSNKTESTEGTKVKLGLKEERLVQLNQALLDSWLGFYQTRWTIFYCSLFFTACILYDFASDQAGFFVALWVPASIVFFLVVIRFFLTDLIQYVQFSKNFERDRFFSSNQHL
jgi:hypothetical protein